LSEVNNSLAHEDGRMHESLPTRRLVSLNSLMEGESYSQAVMGI